MSTEGLIGLVIVLALAGLAVGVIVWARKRTRDERELKRRGR